MNFMVSLIACKWHNFHSFQLIFMIFVLSVDKHIFEFFYAGDGNKNVKSHTNDIYICGVHK